MSGKAKYIYISPSSNDESQLIEQVNNDINNNKKVFMFTFMDGCGPCNQAKPQWILIEDLIKEHPKYNDTVIALVNNLSFDKIKNAGEQPMGYPNFRYIHDKKVEEYEKDRSADAFIEWINSKTSQKGGRRRKSRKRKSNKRKYNKGIYKTKKRSKKGGVNPAAKREAFITAEKGDLGYIKWILNNGYDVNEKKPFKGATLLHYASHNGHIDLVKLLIKRGADVNAKDIKGYTPLFAASAGGHREVAEILLDNGANVHEDPIKLNPLYAATNQRHHDTALLLVDRGAWPLTLLNNL